MKRYVITALLCLCPLSAVAAPGSAGVPGDGAAVTLEREAAGASSGETGDAAAAEASIESLLPASGRIAGWGRDGDMLSYQPENLWEYINGSAENFLTYDFRTVVAQDYIEESGKGLKVEIYDHGSPLMAFGIYSQYRSPGVDFFEIGNECFGDGYSLHFWKGRYYVKVNVFEESELTARAMEAFARDVAGVIEPAGSDPIEVGCFPLEGLVEKSVTYVTEGVLGRGKLPPAFIGDYETGGDRGQLFIFPLESDAAARTVFDWFAGEIGAGAAGKVPGRVPYLGAVGEDRYRGRMLIFTYDRWMGIAAGFGESYHFADELAGKVAGKLARMKDMKE
jgi:hypothetical protein